VLESKIQNLSNESKKEIYASTSEYFSLALDAYDIISVKNLYRDWQQHISDLPSNIYHITADGSDIQRLIQDLSVL
jgi:arabinogalactan endo-1,4-beta-galactosidase